MPSTRCGTIALAGRANAGKSTLLNALVGESLAIVSARPQSTRQAVIGIHTAGDTQLCFVDPPGFLEPDHLLQHAMLEQARAVLRHAHAVVHLHPLDAPDQPAPPLRTLFPDLRPDVSVCVAYTKADILAPERRPPVVPPDLLVSARTGEGLPDLLAWCRLQAPPGPFDHDPENISSQPLRFFVSEFVREAAFELLGEELPYALAADVDEFREGSDPLYIRVTVYVERQSQKGMVVGKGGGMIRDIGARARARIETFLDTRVYLDLWVKTLPKWRSTPGALRRLGFIVPTARPA
jgi:GTP-binding protein Era